MQNTKTVSIASRSYILEDSAHTILSNYLSTVKRTLSEDAEILSDIEVRISERLETMRGNNLARVFTEIEVKSIVDKLGSANEIVTSLDPKAKKGFPVKKFATIAGIILLGTAIIAGGVYGVSMWLANKDSIQFSQAQIDSLNTKSGVKYSPSSLAGLLPKIVFEYKADKYLVYTTGKTNYKGKDADGKELSAAINEQITTIYTNTDNTKVVSIQVNRYTDKTEAQKGNSIIETIVKTTGEGFISQELKVTNAKTWFLTRYDAKDIGDNAVASFFISFESVPASIQISFGKGYSESEIKSFITEYLNALSKPDTKYVSESALITTTQYANLVYQIKVDEMNKQFEIDKQKSTDLINQEYQKGLEDMEKFKKEHGF